jgi:hypothetical protein
MRALLSILAIAAVTVGACHFGRTWFEVANETNEPLDIVRQGNWADLGPRRASGRAGERLEPG